MGTMEGNNIRFTGSWDDDTEYSTLMLLAKALEPYHDVRVECFCRTTGVPFKAIVQYQGRLFGPVAYGPNALVQNIKACLPVMG